METKEDVYQEMVDAASKIHNPSTETREQAFARYTATPEGREMMRKHRAAPFAPMVIMEKPDPYAGRPAEKAAREQIEQVAGQLVTAQGLTPEQAFDAVWQSRPDLRTAYRQAQTADSEGQGTPAMPSAKTGRARYLAYLEWKSRDEQGYFVC